MPRARSDASHCALSVCSCRFSFCRTCARHRQLVCRIVETGVTHQLFHLLLLLLRAFLVRAGIDGDSRFDWNVERSNLYRRAISYILTFLPRVGLSFTNLLLVALFGQQGKLHAVAGDLLGIAIFHFGIRLADKGYSSIENWSSGLPVRTSYISGIG